jgi:2-polyprenyl-6-hydroxyphenyl methylase/3-demethylubiquinone-9 3-methyltransferase
MVHQGYTVAGVDGSKQMIAAAREMSSRGGLPGLSFDVMDSGAFSLQAETYDAVVCSSVLEYIAEDIEILRKLVGVLRPGGVLLISVPHTSSLLGKVEDCVCRLRRIRQKSARRDHDYSRRRYNVACFESTLSEAGMQVVGRTFFEVPLLGRIGMLLSRCRRLGLMVLVTAVKRES